MLKNVLSLKSVLHLHKLNRLTHFLPNMLLPPTHPPHREFVWGVLCSGRLRGRRWLPGFFPVRRQGPGDVQGWIRCVQFSFNTLRLWGNQKELIVTARDIGIPGVPKTNSYFQLREDFHLERPCHFPNICIWNFEIPSWTLQNSW